MKDQEIRGLVADVKEGTLSRRSFMQKMAAVGIAAAVAGGVMAALGMIDSAASLVDAIATHDEFAARTTAITDLAISINRNALMADAIGF